MVSQKTVTIITVSRENLDFCNSRRLQIEVLSDEILITISLCSTPLKKEQYHSQSSDFNWFWENAKEGMDCKLLQTETNNYLKPL